MLETEKISFEKTVLVGIITQNQPEDKLLEYLDELEFLTFTAGGSVMKRFFQKMENQQSSKTQKFFHQFYLELHLNLIGRNAHQEYIFCLF